ncbi:MAG: hypothetical protein JSS76_16085 [Bacteroidetes bacterium]|nr:hypothetical protein [Bacteroidota bacterium]
MKKSGDISLKVNMDFGELLAIMAKANNPDKPKPKKEVKPKKATVKK